MISQDFENYSSPLSRLRSSAKKPVFILIEDDDQDSTELLPQSDASFATNQNIYKPPRAFNYFSNEQPLDNCATRSISKDLNYLLQGKNSKMPSNPNTNILLKKVSSLPLQYMVDSPKRNAINLEEKSELLSQENNQKNIFAQLNLKKNIHSSPNTQVSLSPTQNDQPQTKKSFGQVLKNLYRDYQLQQEQQIQNKQQKKRIKRNKKELKRLLQLQNQDQLQTSDDIQLIQMASYRYKIPSIVSMIQELAQKVKNDKQHKYTCRILISQKPSLNINSTRSKLFISHLRSSLKKRRYIDVD